MDLEEISRENLHLLAAEVLKKRILEEYKVELESLYLAAKDGLYQTTINAKYHKDLYPLLTWLIDKGFFVYCPAGHDEWRVCNDKTDEGLKRYSMYVIEWY